MELRDYIPHGNKEVKQIAQGFLYCRDATIFPDFNAEALPEAFKQVFGLNNTGNLPALEQALIDLHNLGTIGRLDREIMQATTLYAALERKTMVMPDCSFAYQGPSIGKVYIQSPLVAVSNWPKFWDFLRDSQLN